MYATDGQTDRRTDREQCLTLLTILCAGHMTIATQYCSGRQSILPLDVDRAGHGLAGRGRAPRDRGSLAREGGLLRGRNSRRRASSCLLAGGELLSVQLTEYAELRRAHDGDDDVE